MGVGAVSKRGHTTFRLSLRGAAETRNWRCCWREAVRRTRALLRKAQGASLEAIVVLCVSDAVVRGGMGAPMRLLEVWRSSLGL